MSSGRVPEHPVATFFDSTDDMASLEVITEHYPLQIATFNSLNAGDLVRIAKTSKVFQDILNRYLRRAYDINERLLPFIRNPDSFRRMQFSTGAIISGSFALQFFTRLVWPDTGLDMFVGSRFKDQAGEWLLRNGYSYRPATIVRGGVSETQSLSYSEAIKCPGFRGVFLLFLLDVLDFVWMVDGVERRICLHVTRGCPVETVLRFPFSELNSIAFKLF